MPARLKNEGLAALYDQNRNWGSVCVWGGGGVKQQLVKISELGQFYGGDRK